MGRDANGLERRKEWKVRNDSDITHNYQQFYFVLYLPCRGKGGRGYGRREMRELINWMVFLIIEIVGILLFIWADLKLNMARESPAAIGFICLFFGAIFPVSIPLWIIFHKKIEEWMK